jgi:hypothetical protein
VINIEIIEAFFMVLFSGGGDFKVSFKQKILLIHFSPQEFVTRFCNEIEFRKVEAKPVSQAE